MSKSKDYFKEYASKHKEKRNSVSREWYETNKAQKLAYQQQYRKDNPAKVLYLSCRTRARLRGIPFDLVEGDITIPEFCPVLHMKLEVSLGKGIQRNSPSLDRIDPTKGYTKDNIWVISHLANRMKNDATEEELITFSKWVLNTYA